VRLLANENFPGEAIDALRNAGFDVAWIRTDCPGVDDQEVIKRANEDKRIILTFDKDFGELVFRSGFAVEGIILFRISKSSPSYIAQIALNALKSRDDWGAHFSVIEDRRIRMTPLPY